MEDPKDPREPSAEETYDGVPLRAWSDDPGEAWQLVRAGWPPRPLEVWNPEAAAAYFRRCGRKYDIPECCIDEFVADVLVGRAPAQLRGTLPKATGAYVPCRQCLTARRS